MEGVDEIMRTPKTKGKKRIKIGKVGWFVEIGETRIGNEFLVDSEDVKGFAQDGVETIADQIVKSVLATYRKLTVKERCPNCDLPWGDALCTHSMTEYGIECSRCQHVDGALET